MKSYARQAMARSASLRLTDEDFAATLPQAPAKARKSIEGRLFSWAADVATRLPSRFGALEVHAVRDPEGDGSGVVFVRERFARKTLEDLAEDTRSLRPRMGEAPYLPHLHVALVVYFEAVELRIEVPARAWVDLENLRARLADPSALLELTSALELLPEAFEIVSRPGPAQPVLAQRATADDLRERCETARADQTSFRVQWRIPKATVVGFPEDLGDALEDALYALSSVTKLVAWAADNDVLGIVTRWEARRERRFRDLQDGQVPVPSERPVRRGSKSADEEADEASERTTRREARAPASEVGKSPTSEREGERERERDSGGARPMLLGSAGRIERKILRRAPRLFDVDPHAPIEKGTRVQVLSGPFAGRVGAVMDLFPTGDAKVTLGLLVTHVARGDLVACAPKGAGRAPLPSSHRRLPSK